MNDKYEKYKIPTIFMTGVIVGLLIALLMSKLMLG